MAKYHGKIGFASLSDNGFGVFTEEITERIYSGELVNTRKRTQKSDGVNDDVNISGEISIVADKYANENLFAMKYVEFMGAKWVISEIEPQYPRLILSIGGLYHDQ